MTNRRTFIKNSCLACISLSSLGILIESCGVTYQVLRPELQTNQLHVLISVFDINKNAPIIIRNKKLEYDILLVKENNEFIALQMKCTHNGVALNLAGNQLVCNAHGSLFNFEGNSTKEPAIEPLKIYKTKTTDTEIIITI
jgi:cytochrome b6-f complex iron-sulfur subunit